MSNEIRSLVEPPAQTVRWSITLEGDLHQVQAAEELLLEHCTAYAPKVTHVSQRGATTADDEEPEISLTVELDWNSRAIERMILQEIQEYTNDRVRTTHRTITEDR